MHPEIAKNLVEQRRQELARCSPGSQPDHTGSARAGWLSRRLPRWHVSWSRTVLSPAGAPGLADGGRSDRPGQGGGSSLVIIISARRAA
jgi:hypothetical protein